MIYAVILASGVGSRFKSNIPKQFVKIDEKPLIYYTIERFFDIELIDKIIIVVNEVYLEYMEKIILDYFDISKVIVINGGKTRMNSAINAIDYISTNLTYNHDDIVITHDGVRFNVSNDMIINSIDSAKIHDAVTTVIPATDTIIMSSNKTFIEKTFNRNYLFQVQTPQTFKLVLLSKLLKNTSKKDLQKYTDLASIFLDNDYKVHMINGDVNNIKLTYDNDYEFALKLVKNRTLNKV